MQREKPSTETGLLKSLSSEEINQITILAKISEVLNSEVPPDTMFEHLLKLLCVSMKAERGFVELFSPGGEPVRFARDFSQQETREDFPYTRSLVRQCLSLIHI